MFVSSYACTIDSKGRVSIPAAFRSELAGSSRLFLWLAIDGSGALEGGGEALMEMYRETLSELPPQSPARAAIVACVFAGAADLKIDETGRIKLPEPLCAAAGLTGQIIFTGELDSFRIWNPERHDIYKAQMQSVARQPETIAAFAEAFEKIRQRRKDRP